MTHICVGKLTIIGSDNALSPGRRQAIIWTNAGILLNEPLGTNWSEILIGIQIFSFKKMRLKMSSAKWRLFCLGLNVLTRIHHTVPMWSIAACPNSLVMEIRHVFNCTRHARTEAKPTPLTKWASFLQDRELQRYYSKAEICGTLSVSSLMKLVELYYSLVHKIADNYITTHLLSIDRADWSKQPDMFKARNAKIWQCEFPQGFPV